MPDNFPAETRLYSFKEIDELHHLPKGSAFRAFKRVREQLQEGKHFYYLNAQACSDQIDTLRQTGRIYASTVNAVLLTEAGYDLVHRALG